MHGQTGLLCNLSVSALHKCYSHLLLELTSFSFLFFFLRAPQAMMDLLAHQERGLVLDQMFFDQCL